MRIAATAKQYPEAAGLVLSLLAGSIFFAFTSPSSLSSPILVAGFLCVFLAAYFALRLLLCIMGFTQRLTPFVRSLTAWGGAGIVTVFLAMQSIGQLTKRDAITMLILFAVGCFYAIRMRRQA